MSKKSESFMNFMPLLFHRKKYRGQPFCRILYHLHQAIQTKQAGPLATHKPRGLILRPGLWGRPQESQKKKG